MASVPNTNASGIVRPVLWTDFNTPTDAEDCHLGLVDEVWLASVRPGIEVVLSDAEGLEFPGVTVGHAWSAPSGRVYVRVRRLSERTP